MLVVTRRNGQKLRIGNDVEITIYAKGQVRVGIEAPKEVKVLRSELDVRGREHPERTGQILRHEPSGGGTPLGEGHDLPARADLNSESPACRD